MRIYKLTRSRVLLLWLAGFGWGVIVTTLAFWLTWATS